MPDLIKAVAAFVADNAVGLFALSIGSLVVASILGTMLIARLPADYFLAPRRTRNKDYHWLARLAGVVAKNTLGVVLMLAGVVMLFTPGQGVLTLLAGLILADFPGKYALERSLARRPRVLKTLNWVRARNHAPPFIAPE